MKLRYIAVGCALIGWGASMGAFAQSPDALRARDQDVAGHPPRLAPLKPDEVGADAEKVMDEVRDALGLPPTANKGEYMAIMARDPALYQRHTALAVELVKNGLSPRDRELVVLRVAWLCQAPFEWGEHVKAGKRVANMTDEEIDWIKRGSSAPGWNENDRTILRAVEELHDKAMISDETWAALARRLNDKQLIALPLLVGQYQGTAFLQNSLRVPLLPTNPGLTAR
jgi:alkylhydroperoxidase family enzyme